MQKEFKRTFGVWRFHEISGSSPREKREIHPKLNRACTWNQVEHELNVKPSSYMLDSVFFQIFFFCSLDPPGFSKKSYRPFDRGENYVTCPSLGGDLNAQNSSEIRKSNCWCLSWTDFAPKIYRLWELMGKIIDQSVFSFKSAIYYLSTSNLVHDFWLPGFGVLKSGHKLPSC